MWKEEDHPRGQPSNKGQFVEKESQSTAESLIDFYSDDPERDKKLMRESGQLISKALTPEKAYGFADKERKNTRHHITHAKEMGYKNQDEYERAAIDFFNSDKGKLYYSDKNDRYYRYDDKQGLLVVSSKGVIHTFMTRTNKEFDRKIKQDGLTWIR